MMVTYSAAATPIVREVSDYFGPSVGGSTLTIEGSGFSSDSSIVSVKVDDVACEVTSSTST